MLLSFSVNVEASSNTSMGDQLVQTAQKYLGKPYLYGSSEYSTASFDCSSFTKRVFGEKGIWLPRTTSDQFGHGTPIHKDQLKQGDLLFYATGSPGRVSHVGIYVGNGKMINAASSNGVSYADAFSPYYWGPRYLGARRISEEKPAVIAPVIYNANVTIDGIEQLYSQKPIIRNGTTLIPLKDIFINLGAEVNWDSETRTVIGTKDDIAITLQIDTNAVTKNGIPVKLDQPAEIINGKTMIPLKFVSETLGAKIKWEQETRTVHILTVSINSELLTEET